MKSRRYAPDLCLTGWLILAIAAGEFLRDDASQALAANGALHGVVLTTNGLPISNATVTIKKVLAGRGAVYIRDAPDCNRHTITTADGSFTFEGLQEQSKLEGVATAAGYELQGFWRTDPAHPLEIRMVPSPKGVPAQPVCGTVLNSDGRPVEGAKIQVGMLHTKRDWHSGGGLAYTDEQGAFTFQPREEIVACDFTIEANGYVSKSFSEVSPGPDATVYYLSKGASVTGRLLKDGLPVPDAGIGIYGYGSNGRVFPGESEVVTDANGRFTFAGLPKHQKFYVFGIMRSLRELGALPRQRVETGNNGTQIDLGDLNLVKGYRISGILRMADGKPARAGAFTLARTELTPPSGHTPTSREESNRSFYGLEFSFDNWRADPGPDGRFEFDGVPGETISIFLKLKPFDMLSPANISSDGKGFRLLGMVVSNKTDLVIELEPHDGQIFPPARDYGSLSHQPLQGAEAAVRK